VDSDLLKRKLNSDDRAVADGSHQGSSNYAHDFSRISLFPLVSKHSQHIFPQSIPETSLESSNRQQFVNQTRAGSERHPFRATIKRQSSAGANASRQDSPPAIEAGDQELLAEIERLVSDTDNSFVSDSGEADNSNTLPATSTGVAIRVPDVVIPELAALNRSDAVNATFTYSSSIAQGGAAPTGFGVTRSFSSRLSGISITPNSGTFDVAATFEHPITYQIRSGTGPSGQKDIASATDSDITSSNYTTVVSDLTPNMSDLNGRPPRTGFWAEDLTLRHELVHVNDDNANGPGAMASVTTWLNGQTAASVAQVRGLLAALSTPAGERHAYGDGAPAYRARANRIKAKGDAGDYRGLSTGAKAAIGAGGGALVGAGIGAAVGGPIGALVGAGAGALVGGLGSLLF
jgi:hypothetical protein